jgi:hypothetical protein
MEIRIGDRFMDQELEWEVVTQPASLHGGKSLRARVWRPGLPESEREITWAAHERVEIRRGHHTVSTQHDSFGAGATGEGRGAESGFPVNWAFMRPTAA